MEFQADDACRQLQQLPHSGALWPGDLHAASAKCETEVKQQRHLLLKFFKQHQHLHEAQLAEG